MNDSDKWMAAAAGIEQDLQYLMSALQEEDIKQLRIALTVYRENADKGVPWPEPDDLYCIQTLPRGSQVIISTEMRRDFRMAC
ncbi:MAG TPA: hypothetical protein VLT16_14275 [Candidatus Limnocylindrales bacterium]|nr:hypothetical protein [Candidatus Limnocylindrales bacterium]